MNNNSNRTELIVRAFTIGLVLFVFTELNNNNYSETNTQNTIAISAIYELNNNAIFITPAPNVIKLRNKHRIVNNLPII